MSWRLMAAVLLVLAMFVAPSVQDGYCDEIQASGSTSCHDCVEITFLGGRHDCSYCANPYTGFTSCQSSFYPTQADIPGFTVYACYNDSGVGVAAIARFKPRCASKDCYVDQCTISGVILWYIIVPSVVGGILLIGGAYLLWCCHKRRQRAMKAWVEKEQRAEKKEAEKRSEKSRQRNNERKNKTDELRRKYGLLEDDEEDL